MKQQLYKQLSLPNLPIHVSVRSCGVESFLGSIDELFASIRLDWVQWVLCCWSESEELGGAYGGHWEWVCQVYCSSRWAWHRDLALQEIDLQNVSILPPFHFFILFPPFSSIMRVSTFLWRILFSNTFNSTISVWRTSYTYYMESRMYGPSWIDWPQ